MFLETHFSNKKRTIEEVSRFAHLSRSTVRRAYGHPICVRTTNGAEGRGRAIDPAPSGQRAAHPPRVHVAVRTVSNKASKKATN